MGKVAKIVVWSLIVGLALAAFGLSASDVWAWLAETVQGIGANLASLARWMGPYALAGAGVVVPIWLGLWGLRWWRRNRGRRRPGA